MTSLAISEPAPSTTAAVQSSGISLLGGGPSYVLNPSTERYRITWRFVAAFIVPDSSLDSYRIAEAVRDSLASLGMVPVSPIAAVAGDPFVQFTVQVARSGNLQTIADMIDAANRLPVFSTQAGGVSLRIALDVSEIEIRSAGLSTTIVAAQDYASRQRAFDDARRRDVVTQAQQAVAAGAGAIGAGVGALGSAAERAGQAAGEGIGGALRDFFAGISDILKLAIVVAGVGIIGVAIVAYNRPR